MIAIDIIVIQCYIIEHLLLLREPIKIMEIENQICNKAVPR